MEGENCFYGRAGRQSFLLMVFVCGTALTNQAWWRWYETIFPPVFTVMALLALAYVLRK